MNPSILFDVANKSLSSPIWDILPIDDAFTITSPNADNNPSTAVVKSVSRPWLFGFEPTTPSKSRAIIILGGGGYVELMVGREGVQVAKWFTNLGFHCFVLVHRFPNAQTTAQAPLDDARQGLRMIKEKGFGKKGLGVCGLSSGGHLGAALLSTYPEQWTEKGNGNVPNIDFAIIGYAPISTNAVGRQVVSNKPRLEPKEKQELYDTVQPDIQLTEEVPPCFVVYSGNDPVVPVVNAYRLAQGIDKASMRGEKSEKGKVELHIFADAPHGFALDADIELPVSRWTGMCEAWMRQSRFLDLST